MLKPIRLLLTVAMFLSGAAYAADMVTPNPNPATNLKGEEIQKESASSLDLPELPKAPELPADTRGSMAIPATSPEHSVPQLTPEELAELEEFLNKYFAEKEFNQQNANPEQVPQEKPAEGPKAPIIDITAKPGKFPVDIIGGVPKKVHWLIHQLSAFNRSGVLRLKTRLILHGPPGNGKSMLARFIAHMTNRTFVSLDGPSIVNRFQGSGAEKIETLFKETITNINNTGVNALVFIDEIDAIAGSNESEHRADHKAALQQLWLEIDRYANDPRIFIIVATNHFKKLDAPFKDRFGENAIVELKNPGITKRRMLLEHYLANHNLSLSADLIDTLIKKSKGISIRSLEYFVDDLAMTAELENNGVVTEKMALSILKKIKSNAEKDTDEEWKKKLDRTHTYIGIVGGTLGALVSIQQLIGVNGGLFAPLFAALTNMPKASNVTL